jgi:hypothetical protein
MKDKNGNKIMIGDRLKIIWTKNNREYVGNVIGIKGKIVLLSVKNYMVYVNNPNKLLKTSIS